MPFEIPIVSTEELEKLIDSTEKFVLIDVRKSSECKHGMIPSAHNVPIEEIPDAFALTDEEFEEKYKFVKPKKEDRIIFHCRTGRRSERVSQFVKGLGYKYVESYKDSTEGWAKTHSDVKSYPYTHTSK